MALLAPHPTLATPGPLAAVGDWAGWPWLRAYAEAAMVGGLADWFAVTALFRRPLGLPIPHTAILPTRKAKLARGLADFIVERFARPDALRERLAGLDLGRRVGRWLADTDHARALAERVDALRPPLRALLDDPQLGLRGRGLQLLRERLQGLDVAPLAARLADELQQRRRHQALLDAVLPPLAGWLADEDLQARLADSIAQELRYLSVVRLDQVAGRVVARKLVDGAGRLAAAVAETPDHPLRQRLDSAFDGWVQRLHGDATLADSLRAGWLALLRTPDTDALLDALWDGLRRQLDRALDDPARASLAPLVRRFGERLQSDGALRDWAQALLLEAAEAAVHRHRPALRDYLVDEIDRWDTASLSAELESQLGPDLQYVRINGTLVGGLVGLTLHAVQRLAGL
ncbi:MAG: hypothetical protein RL223_2978 [Pseudomonadota bacterium]